MAENGGHRRQSARAVGPGVHGVVRGPPRGRPPPRRVARGNLVLYYWRVRSANGLCNDRSIPGPLPAVTGMVYVYQVPGIYCPWFVLADSESIERVLKRPNNIVFFCARLNFKTLCIAVLSPKFRFVFFSRKRGEKVENQDVKCRSSFFPIFSPLCYIPEISHYTYTNVMLPNSEGIETPLNSFRTEVPFRG